MTDTAGSSSTGLVQAFRTAKVIPSPDVIANRVRDARRARPSADSRELSGRVIDASVRRVTQLGVAGGLPATVPGAGTLIQLGAGVGIASGEMWAVLRNLTTMQMTVAGLYGHDLDAPERLDEMVLIWALEGGVVVPATEAGKRIGTKVAVSSFNKHVSGAVFKRINQRLGTTVVTKWGTKRGGVAVGRLIPFGVGAAVGGGVNYMTAKAYGRHVLRFYSEIQPNDEELIIVDA